MKFSTSAVIAFAAAAASVPAALAADTTLYKVANSECGQATLDSKYATRAEEFAGLKEGTCSSQGYTASSGSKSITVPL